MRIVQRVRLPHVLVDLIAPPRCAVCAAECDHDRVLCIRCDRDLARGRGHELRIGGIDSAWAARPYEGVARDLVHAIKFRRLLPAAKRGAELIAAEAPAGLVSGTIVPVPADPIRLAWRGFDPADELASELARRSGLSFSTCLRRSHGARQVGRSRRERLAARLRVEATRPAPPAALLVDDVTTTGATLAACATALRSAGCAEVRAVVLAAART